MQIIQAEELKKRIDNQEQIYLIDVREPGEHAAYNIGGILLPLGKIQSMLIDEIEDLREVEIICYCRSGQRSMQAMMLLTSIGFKNVKNLVGGMLEWQSKF